MILSMTGFAAVAAELPGCSLTVELRSVNHRYLDLQVRLPDELRSIESAVRDVLALQLKRGKVDCRVALNRSAPGTTELAVNAERVIQLRDAADEVLRHAPESMPLSIVEVLRWPGVLTEPSLGAEALTDKALELTDTEARRPLYEEASRILVEDAAGLFVYNTKWFGPFTKNVHDVRFCPIGDAQDIRWMSMT